MSDELKPTNKQIAEYVWSWIAAFDIGGMLTIKRKDQIKLALQRQEFKILREMFGPPMYDSIDEWARDN